MSITTISGHFVHYEVLGRGEPLILIHSFLGSWRYWWPTMQSLSRFQRTFAFDLWGYGNSSKWEDAYDFESYVAMLPEFVDTLGISRPFNLAGHGLGAALVLQYARLFPDDVNKLITVSLPVHGSSINNQLFQHGPDIFVKRYLDHLVNFPELTKEIKKTDGLAFHQIVDQLSSCDFVHDINSLETPHMTVIGDRDEVVESHDFLNPLLKPMSPQFHHMVLEECNHFPMLEQPAVFNRLLFDFLQDELELQLQPKIYWQRRTR